MKNSVQTQGRCLFDKTEDYMQYKYMRIQGRETSWITKYPKGIFSMCWRMIQDGVISKKDEEKFRDIDEWFKENLLEPEPCKNGEAVITFFNILKLLVTCDANSKASEKVILANGGIYEKTIDVGGCQMKRYWIKV